MITILYESSVFMQEEGQFSIKKLLSDSCQNKKEDGTFLVRNVYKYKYIFYFIFLFRDW